MNRPLVERGTGEREKPPFPSLSSLFFPQTESLFTGYEAPTKVSGGSRTLVCIKGFTFSHFSGKASAGAQDTRDDEAPPEKCNIYVVVQFYPWFTFYVLLFLGMVMYDNDL